MLTIIASMERELSGLRREISSVKSNRSSDLRVVGVGKSRSRTRLREILKAGSGTSPRVLLMLGFAGAVDPELKTGDLVLSSKYYVEFPGEDYLPPDSEMRQNAIIAAANAGFPVHHLDSLTVDGIVSTSSVKAALGEKYPVGIVGMEDYWLALTAQDSEVPFISVRAVLDTAHQHLPVYLPGLSQGRSLDVLRMVAMPWRVPPLLKLAYQARIAQQSLTRFAVSFVRQWESEGDASTETIVAVA